MTFQAKTKGLGIGAMNRKALVGDLYPSGKAYVGKAGSNYQSMQSTYNQIRREKEQQSAKDRTLAGAFRKTGQQAMQSVARAEARTRRIIGRAKRALQ